MAFKRQKRANRRTVAAPTPTPVPTQPQPLRAARAVTSDPAPRPLGAPANPATLLTDGLTIVPSRVRSVLAPGPYIVNMRLQCMISFIDRTTKLAVSPTGVSVVTTNPLNVDTTIILSEITMRPGTFWGGFIPTIVGEWKFRALVGIEVVDTKRVYVDA